MKCILLLYFLLWFQISHSQTNRYNPDLNIQKLAAYRADVESSPDMEMVSLSKLIPHVRYDLRYATTHNFTQKRMYPSGTRETYLRKPVAQALGRVASALDSLGLGIWVWDAYRPYHVTVDFWELIHDERYVAHPGKGSGHNRGIAIDMTLYELASGRLMDMPTGFDDFSSKAHHGDLSSTSQQIKNRELLKNMMEKYGFKAFDTEWWHYYWKETDRFGVLDIPFNALKNNQHDPER